LVKNIIYIYTDYSVNGSLLAIKRFTFSILHFIGRFVHGECFVDLAADFRFIFIKYLQSEDLNQWRTRPRVPAINMFAHPTFADFQNSN